MTDGRAAEDTAEESGSEWAEGFCLRRRVMADRRILLRRLSVSYTFSRIGNNRLAMARRGFFHLEEIVPRFDPRIYVHPGSYVMEPTLGTTNKKGAELFGALVSRRRALRHQGIVMAVLVAGAIVVPVATSVAVMVQVPEVSK